MTATPNYADAGLVLPASKLRNGQAGLAVTALDGLLKPRPELVKAQTLLADAYRAAGMLDDSAAVVRKQLSTTPEKPEPFLLPGFVHRQQPPPAVDLTSSHTAPEPQPDDD